MTCDYTALAAPGVRELMPYKPGKPIDELERELGISDSIKLASNENPLGTSPAAMAAIRDEIDDLWLYPDATGYGLKATLAERHDIDAARITLGNGSNDVLVLLAEAFLTPGANAVYSKYCFAVYPIATQATGARARVAPALAEDHERAPLGHDLAAMGELVDTDTRLVFIANPNNPTGTWLGQAELRAFIEGVPEQTLVVVDEAYTEYTGGLDCPDASRWLDEFPNLVVTRTFSKAYGLAGLRVGYALSNPQVSDLLNRIRQPFNVNSLGLVAARAALGDTEFIERSQRINREGLESLGESLSALGFRVLPSAANFVLVDCKQPASPWYEALLRKGVIVRGVENYDLPNHMRVTVGTPEQNRRLIDTLAELQQMGLDG